MWFLLVQFLKPRHSIRILRCRNWPESPSFDSNMLLAASDLRTSQVTTHFQLTCFLHSTATLWESSWGNQIPGGRAGTRGRLFYWFYASSVDQFTHLHHFFFSILWADSKTGGSKLHQVMTSVEEVETFHIYCSLMHVKCVMTIRAKKDCINDGRQSVSSMRARVILE